MITISWQTAMTTNILFVQFHFLSFLNKLDHVVLLYKKKTLCYKGKNKPKSIMASQGYPISGLLVLLGLLTNFITVSSSHESTSFNRTSFPKGFIFGTAAAAYQVTKSKFSLC